MGRKIEVVPYDPSWPTAFGLERARVSLVWIRSTDLAHYVLVAEMESRLSATWRPRSSGVGPTCSQRVTSASTYTRSASIHSFGVEA